ncbi:rhodanese-like domain-containing protein [Myroides sp. DF42-4-2]|uniref:rhodanese-like domain-containing protein n=1 Tax=unclassified Myroides TaxID=2642485 RepID=UPI0025789C5B|nr:rhodanese-like domain-containing protein [Myroides sp. DF42-4-2]MDM1406770.1 rhodanese-like domain-containing protein [Myroides sp. DF42-4-2]
MLQWLKSLFGSSEAKVDWAKALKEGALLIDVRSQGEYLGGGAKKAINIPLDQLTTKIGRYSKDTPIIVYCRSGMRSQQAKRVLEQLGYQQVYNAGGVRNVIKQIG